MKHRIIMVFVRLAEGVNTQGLYLKTVYWLNLIIKQIHSTFKDLDPFKRVDDFFTQRNTIIIVFCHLPPIKYI